MPEYQNRTSPTEPRLSAARFPSRGFNPMEKLEERWAFPSDHIPVAAEVFGIRIGSWNVLNQKWVHYFRDDKEGLARSALITEDSPIMGGLPHVAPRKAGEVWTRREEHTLQIVLGLCRKLHVLALQECSAEFTERLEYEIPPHISLLRGRSDNPENDIVLLYSTRKLQINRTRSEFHQDAYRCKEGRALMDLWLEPHTGRPLKLIHTHVPGDPLMPGLEELAGRYLKAPAIERGAPLLVAGDLNFTEERIRSVFAQFPMPTFLRLSCGNSTVGADGRPKGIDHILAFNIEAYFCRALARELLGDEVAGASKLINP